MDFTSLEPRLETALQTPTPRAGLQKLMNELLERGYERSDLLPALEAFHAHLARQNRSEEADLILEIIDGFTGWCRPLPGRL